MDEQARQFLSRRRLAHLSTSAASGEPHVVPVCFALVGDHVYIAIDEKPKQGNPLHLRRLRNIAENPRVALVADAYDDRDWSRLGFVLVHGTARQVTDGPEHVTALAALRAKYPQYVHMALETKPVIAVAIERTSSWGVLADG